MPEGFNFSEEKKVFIEKLTKVSIFHGKISKIKLPLDVQRAESYGVSCNCHILEKTKTLTRHSELQDWREGSNFFCALDINIFTCCDVGPLGYTNNSIALE